MTFNRFTGFLVGTGIGAAVMLLYAPKSGKATRRYLSHRADDGREVAERYLSMFEDLRKDIQNTADRTLSRFRKAVAV